MDPGPPSLLGPQLMPFFGFSAPDHSALSEARTLFVDVEGARAGGHGREGEEAIPPLTRRRRRRAPLHQLVGRQRRGKGPAEVLQLQRDPCVYDQDARLTYGRLSRTWYHRRPRSSAAQVRAAG